MTDSQNKVIKFEFPQIVNEAFKPLASSIGSTLSNLWDGTFIGINTWYKKKSIEQEYNLLLYKEQIQKNMSSIKEENIQEPKMSIVGPALESSKFYFEESHFREMFAKLLASACDSSKSNYIHPSFTEIIKQLDAKDAKVLKTFRYKSKQSIYDYVATAKGGTSSFLKNVFFINHDYSERECYCSSITNLVRLGIISTDYIRHLINDPYLDFVKNDPFFEDMKENFKELNQLIGNQFTGFTAKSGVVELTPLGNDFVKICL